MPSQQPAPDVSFWDTHRSFPGPPRGSEARLGGVDVYVTHPTRSADGADVDVYVTPGADGADVDAQPPRAVVILVPDCFGVRFTPLRTLADALAAASGASVVLPDMYAGNALDPDALAQYYEFKKTQPDWWPATALHEAVGNTMWFARLPFLLSWMWSEGSNGARHEAVLADVAAAARKELGARCVGAFGAELGGIQAFMLAGRLRARDPAAPSARIDALVVAHPGSPSNPALASLGRVACPSLWFFSASDADGAVQTAVKQGLSVRIWREGQTQPTEFVTQPQFSAVADTDAKDEAGRAKAVEAQAGAQEVLAQAAAFFRTHLRVDDA